MSDSSYSNTDIFLDWLKFFFFFFFRRHAVSGKVVLIIDGHSSHVKSTTVLDYCMPNNIILVCLPGHTTQYLQPLDRAVYKSLKCNFQTVTNLFKRRNPEMSITKYRFGSLFAAAWARQLQSQKLLQDFVHVGSTHLNLRSSQMKLMNLQRLLKGNLLIIWNKLNMPWTRTQTQRQTPLLITLQQARHLTL